ncbi:anthocyanidin 3-O-glucosyltransferase 2-like [Rhododendron vialii]|uniref:anthocyanidin 3-O-glucosyltransferase 2-like n=1 Tax=Rhododendron vialii TaxID=182163 RepID=UPI00265FC606|nr:anthocyanidin 3-O-glucosyltransferase 2-like [Rhododendron vialii]
MKAELVFIPSPGKGHLVSAVEMAKQLIGRDHRLSITVLIMKTPFDSKSKVSQSLLLAAAEDRLKFVYLPQEDEAALAKLLSKNPGSLMSEFVNMNKQHVRDHVKKMMISTESTRLAGFVVDMFCTPMMDVAAEFGLPSYAFFTSSCAFLGLMFQLETLNRDHNQDVTELKDSDAELEVPVFVNPVPAKVLPSMVLSKEGGSTFFMEISKRLRETKGIMVNTFEELESYAVKCLAEDDKVPPIYPVGPVLHLVKDENKEEEGVIQIMRWLDDQPPSSVVFLCFGSMGTFEADQVREIAQALEQSGHRFLWSVRQPPPKGKIAMPDEYQDLSEVLPEGFLERTIEIGKVIGWAPQVAVLSHKAVGGFVSHCGWNSTLESLCCGVPMATWPIYAEQQMNAFQLVRELRLAVEIKLDYRKDFGTTNKVNLVTANEIENGIRKLMENEDKSKEGIKQKVKELSEKSKTAVEEGGSSYNYIERFIEVVMTNVHSP